MIQQNHAARSYKTKTQTTNIWLSCIWTMYRVRKNWGLFHTALKLIP